MGGACTITATIPEFQHPSFSFLAVFKVSVFVVPSFPVRGKGSTRSTKAAKVILSRQARTTTTKLESIIRVKRSGLSHPAIHTTSRKIIVKVSQQKSAWQDGR
jgi:hypothetical protein